MEKYKTLDEFYASQTGDQLAQVEAVRNIVMAAAPQLRQTLKWNAPNFVLDDEDRLTMNLMNKAGAVKLIFHMGATKKEDKKAAPVMTDTSGLISWNSDIRGIMTFESSQHVEQVQEQLADLVRRWLAIKP